MNNAKQQQSLLIMAFITTLTFLTMYFTLSFYNRFAFDDFLEILWNRQYGAIASIIGSYKNGDGSILNAVLHQLTIPVFFRLGLLFVFNYISVSLLVLSVYFAFKAIDNKVKALNNNWFIAAIAGVFVTVFYYVSPHTIQCWYWASSMTLYLLPFIIFFFCVGLFVNAENKRSKYILYVLFFLFCLSRITVVLVFPAAFVIYFAYCFLYKQRPSKVLVNLFIISCVGAVIVIIAPGNYARQGVELKFKSTDFSFTHAFFTAMSKISEILVQRLRYYLAAFVVFLWVGSNIRIQENTKSNKSTGFAEAKVFNVLLLSLAAVLLLFICNATLMYIALKQCYYAARVWTHFFLFILLCLSYLAVFTGYRYKIYSKYFCYASILMCMYLSYANIKSVQNILPYNRTYAKNYDENIALLKQAHSENRTSVLYCHPVPENTGLIQSWRVEKDTAAWVNKAVTKIYGLNCGISDTTVVIGSFTRNN